MVVKNENQVIFDEVLNINLTDTIFTPLLFEEIGKAITEHSVLLKKYPPGVLEQVKKSLKTVDWRETERFKINKGDYPHNLNTLEYQGIYAMESLVNSYLRRTKINNNAGARVSELNYGNTIYRGTELGLYKFSFAEDVLWNPEFAEGYSIEEGIRRADELTRDQKVAYLYRYIKDKYSTRNDTISMKEFLHYLDIEYQNEVEKSDNGRMEGCFLVCIFLDPDKTGCCGNRDSWWNTLGCLYYDAVICGTHDILCKCCKNRSLCFSGCKPEPSCGGGGGGGGKKPL